VDVRRNQATLQVEQLIQLTNSENFLNDWAFFITGLNFTPRTDKMIISLEALYDQFDERFADNRKSWKIACHGFFGHHLPIGYLRPFYKLKVLSDHPILWNYGAETFFSVYGPCEDISSLMGDLLLIHNKVCGNWVIFHKVFGFLPALLEAKTTNQLAAPTPLWEHYIKVLQKHNITYTVNETQPNRLLSALVFTSRHFPDGYNYGQPYVTAKTFELIESA